MDHVGFASSPAYWLKKPNPPRSTRKFRRPEASSLPAPDSGDSTSLKHKDTKPSSVDLDSGDASGNDDLSEGKKPLRAVHNRVKGVME